MNGGAFRQRGTWKEELAIWWYYEFLKPIAKFLLRIIGWKVYTWCPSKITFINRHHHEYEVTSD